MINGARAIFVRAFLCGEHLLSLILTSAAPARFDDDFSFNMEVSVNERRI